MTVYLPISICIDEFGINWFLNESGKTLVSDVFVGIKDIGNELRKKIREIKKLQAEFVRFQNEVEKEKVSDMMIINHLNERVQELELKCEIETGNYNLYMDNMRHEMRTLRQKANDLTLDNERIKDEFNTMKQILDHKEHIIIDFPRREEQILKDAEKLIRLRSNAFRQEDNKMKAQLAELKQV